MKANSFLLTFPALVMSMITMTSSAQQQDKSPYTVAVHNYNDLKVTVSYYAPSKKGRLIFGEQSEKAVQPYGKYWCTGAKTPTVFEVNRSILFNRHEVKAGKYRLYAVPGRNSWSIYLNSDWQSNGTGEVDHKSDVLKIEVTPDNDAPLQEKFVIGFEMLPGTNITTMVLHWDKTMVRVPITVRS